MMESERQVTDGNVSFNETTVLHVESFAARQANVRLSRLPHPSNDKWSNLFFFKRSFVKIDMWGLLIKHHLHLMTVCGITRL